MTTIFLNLRCRHPPETIKEQSAYKSILRPENGGVAGVKKRALSDER